MKYLKIILFYLIFLSCLKGEDAIKLQIDKYNKKLQNLRSQIRSLMRKRKKDNQM